MVGADREKSANIWRCWLLPLSNALLACVLLTSPLFGHIFPASFHLIFLLSLWSFLVSLLCRRLFRESLKCSGPRALFSHKGALLGDPLHSLVFNSPRPWCWWLLNLYHQPVLFPGAPRNYKKPGSIPFFEASKHTKKKNFFLNAEQDDRSYSNSFNTHT